MTAQIAELEPLAKQVNDKSNQINVTIRTINEKLANLNLGIEAWLDRDNQALSSSHWRDRNSSMPRTRTVSYLGYDQLGDKWELAVKNMTEELTVEDGEQFIAKVNPQYFPLLQASRDIRVAAMELIPRLLDELKEKGQQLLGTVEAAEKMAKSL